MPAGVTAKVSLLPSSHQDTTTTQANDPFHDMRKHAGVGIAQESSPHSKTYLSEDSLTSLLIDYSTTSPTVHTHRLNEEEQATPPLVIEGLTADTLSSAQNRNTNASPKYPPIMVSTEIGKSPANRDVTSTTTTTTNSAAKAREHGDKDVPAQAHLSTIDSAKSRPENNPFTVPQPKSQESRTAQHDHAVPVQPSANVAPTTTPQLEIHAIAEKQNQHSTEVAIPPASTHPMMPSTGFAQNFGMTLTNATLAFTAGVIANATTTAAVITNLQTPAQWVILALFFYIVTLIFIREVLRLKWLPVMTPPPPPPPTTTPTLNWKVFGTTITIGGVEK